MDTWPCGCDSPEQIIGTALCGPFDEIRPMPHAQATKVLRALRRHYKLTRKPGSVCPSCTPPDPESETP